MTKIIGEGEPSFAFLMRRNRGRNKMDLKNASVEDIREWIDMRFPEMFSEERKQEIIEKIVELRDGNSQKSAD